MKTNSPSEGVQSVGLCLLRVGFGFAMLYGHGYGKFMSFSSIAPQFPDPLMIGQFFPEYAGSLSLGLAVFAEFFCSILLIAGLATRLATVPLMITMSVAFFIVHGRDEWKSSESAFTYLVAYATIFLLGPGKFALDSVVSLGRK